MTDPRIMTLAKNLVNYSCNVQKGEKVLIENFGLTKELVLALIDEVYAQVDILLLVFRIIESIEV